jgi:Uma2 family endonuclease
MILLGDRAITFSRSPVRLDRFSEPQPDLVVVRGPRERYRDAHPAPTDVLLLIEVSDATLRYDRGEKQKAYATAAIPEYWIVDLRHRRIDVCTEPEGDHYRTHTVTLPDQRLAPGAFPTDVLAVSEFLGA